jgi:hypothetical protein
MRVAVALRGRGHEVVAVDASAIASSAAMPLLRDFRLDPGALVAVGRTEDQESALPFDDLACILRAWHRQRVDADTEVTKRSFDATRAIVSGGLVMTKKTTHAVSSKTEAREEVLYLFRRSRQMPWLVRETRAKYGGLGDQATLAPSQRENFVALAQRLRGLAPAAAYDERLLGVKKISEKIAITVGGGTSTVAHSSDAGMDALAHLLALLLSRRAASPYRG